MPKLTPFLPEPVSGEAVPFDPLIIFPGGGIRTGLASIPRLGSKTLDDIAFRFGDFFRAISKDPVALKPAERSFLDSFRSLFRPGAAKPVTTIPGQGAPIKGKFPTKTAIVFGGTATTAGLLTLTPGGQEVIKFGSQGLETIGDIANIFKPLSQTFAASPLLLGGLIILGAILLVKK